MIYNSRAINTLCDKKNLIRVIDDVLNTLVVDADTSFCKVMEHIMSEFEARSSEMVASKLLDIDFACDYWRSHEITSAADVQDMLDHIAFETFDQCAQKVLRLIAQGDYRLAWESYQQLLNSSKCATPQVAKELLHNYLDYANLVSGEVVSKEVLSGIIANLPSLTEKPN